MEDQDSASKIQGILWLVATGILAILTAGGIFIASKNVPWSWEKKTGELLGNPPVEVCHPPPAAKTALEKLMRRIYPLSELDSKFSVEVDFVHDERINAFASLGGKIYVHSKLLQVSESPEELAGVIAHEIGHVENRHVVQGVFTAVLVSGLFYWAGYAPDSAQIFRQVMGLRFSRAQEEQADRAAVDRLLKANVDIAGMRDFFKKLESLSSSWELLSDHPSSQNRSEMVEKFMPVKNSTAILNQETWMDLRKYCL